MKCSLAGFVYSMKCFPFAASSKLIEMEEKTIVEGAEKPERKPGGWKSMPYVIGNETFEKLGTLGLVANIMVYLQDEFHMKQVFATNVVNIWSGTTNFAPLFGAFLSDSYLGRFRTLAYASIASLLGMATLTLTASLRGLRPPSCDPNKPGANCLGATKGQVGVLYLALGLLTIGAGGIRPCSLPFGVDQFDATTEKGRRGIDSFFNWYYFTFTVSLMVALTVIVYIQSSVSWSLGLAIPTFLMLCSITLFFVGTKVYIYVSPEGSIFSSIAQVFVAAYKKRRLELPHANEQPQVLYDPSSPKDSTTSKLPLTQQFRCLNKAAIIAEGELNPDGSPSNHWKLCSIQQVEELKCLIRIMPIWASGIICFTALAQQATFTVSQARKMDRHLGPNFQIPPGSLSVISMFALTVFIPIYDRILIPMARRITKLQTGITILQRMGIGMAISVLSMVVGGLIEEKRRNSANSHQDPRGIAPMTVMWLAPQLVLMGMADAFNGIGQIEFYYKQFPEHMRSIGGSLFFCGFGGANYLSSFIVAIVHNYTGKDGQPNWLDDNLNVGKLDYFYYIIAVFGVLNLAYFLVCARYYRYKGSTQEESEEHYTAHALSYSGLIATQKRTRQ
ncbi:Proton-dependent oligopeptide transporter family [Cinnamomum micranthum f. kanehirae]|uniref:Proton-dependent oligopeptide transporter family n=1 Tax=Cinnamomum micranthum f. kanehirae TaxID=337451 RepID=A0A443NGJ1_9MAGN|nr:Proton-dependent oligopeptide transporter family [Cinnamomum micranthum f. kanehirae]